MRSTTLVRRGGLRRTLAMSAAVATLALSGAVSPAVAQQPDSESDTESGSGAQQVGPPPLDPNVQPSSGKLGPNGNLKQQQACMQESSGGPGTSREPWAQRVLNFDRAHAQGLTGGGIKVAVIDTGVNTHDRLDDGLVPGGSVIPKGGATTDCDGHGTIVAGIISAQPSEKDGFVGIAPDTAILSIRQSSSVFAEEESGKTAGNTKSMAQAVASAVEQGAGVINISQSSCQTIARASDFGDEGNQQLHNAVKYAYDNGVVVVAAAGNKGGSCKQNSPGDPQTAVLPAWFDKYVLTVASVNRKGAPSEFTVPGPWVDVAAPGEGLISLDPGAGADGLANRVVHGRNGQPEPIQGTSFAAPYVSGLAALIQQKYSDLSAEGVMRRITTTAQQHSGNHDGNDIIGYGLINPMAALNDVVPAEHNAAAPPVEPRKLESHVFPHRNWAAVAVALGGAIGGLGTVLFTAFLTNAVRKVKARQAEAPASKLHL